MKLQWIKEISPSSSKYYILKRQTPTIRPFMPAHTHDYAELIYVERGGCTHYVNGSPARVRKGDILFIYPETVEHWYSDYDKSFSILQILFQQDTFSFIMGRYAASVEQVFGETSKNPLVNFGPMQQIWFERNFNTLLVTDGSLIEIERFLLNFIGLVNEAGKSGSATPGSWLERAFREIQEPENFQQGVHGFVDLCGRSGEHVEREVKSRTGHTVTDVVNHARMAWASYMLIFSDMEIVQIAFNTGLNSIGHFYKLFYEHYDIPPAKYRKKMSQGALSPQTSVFQRYELQFQQ